MKVSNILLVAAVGLVPVIGFSATATSADSYYSFDTVKYLTLGRFSAPSGVLNSVAFDVTIDLSAATEGLVAKSITGISATGELLYNVSGATSTISGVDTLIESNPSLYSLNYNLLEPLASSNNVWDYFTTSANTVAFHVTSVDSTLLSSLTGSGSYNIAFDDTYLASIYQTIEGSNVELTTEDTSIGLMKVTPSAKYTVTATYTYAPIPEPSTYAIILGVFTLGLVGWRRFRR